MLPFSIAWLKLYSAIMLFIFLATIFSGCKKQEAPSGPIVITDLPCVITNAGEYKVTTDLTGKKDKLGILVATNHVKIDLGGKSLLGVPGCLSAIALSKGVTNISISNGKIIGWGGGLSGVFSHQGEFKNLTLISNSTGLVVGCSNSIVDCTALYNEGPGFTAHDKTLMKNCRAEGNVGDGIVIGYEAVLEDSICRSNRMNGIFATVFGKIIRCEMTGNTRCGIRAGTSSVVEQCKIIGNHYDGIEGANGVTIHSNLVEANLGNGIGVFGHATVSDNTCIANVRDGIRSAFFCRITNNICRFNGTAGKDTGGIHAVLKGNKIENNFVFTKQTVGIKTSASPNQLLGNIVYQSKSGPGTAYDCKGGMGTEVLKRAKEPGDPVTANYELPEPAEGK